MYHNIDEKSGLNTVSLNNFTKQIEYISNSETYNILNIDDYVSNLINPKVKNPISISFDDAYVSLTTHVLPVIKKFDVPISVFVPVEFVGKHNQWDIDKSYPEIKILNWDELNILATERLITIGSHGVNHISHGNLSEEQDLSEMIISKEKIKQNIGVEVKYYSFPFGQLKDIGKYSNNNLTKAGYTAALSTIWSRKNTYANLLRLNRIEILGNDNLKTFIKKIKSPFYLKSYKQKIKNILFKTKILR